jgi:hypothetical protein
MSSNQDVVVSSTNVVPTGHTQLTKPCYMVKFLDTEEHFIAIDVPKYESGHFEVKGVFTSSETTEDAIFRDYPSMIDHSRITTVAFPWIRTHSVRGLPKRSK